MTRENALFLKIGLVVFGLLVVLVVGCADYGFEFLPFFGIFLVGWMLFLIRVMGDAPWTVTGLLALGLVLLIGLVHLICTWFYPRLRKSKPSEETAPPRWRFRWTVGWLGLVLLFVISGVALLGLSQHSLWLATSPDPMLNHSRGLPNTSRIRLYEMGRAFTNYHSDHSSFPSGASVKQGQLMHSWQTSLLPYLDDDDKGDLKALHQRIRQDLPWNDPLNLPHFRAEVKAYQNPLLTEKHDANGLALSHYAANSRMLGGTKASRAGLNELYDSHTILAGEVINGLKPWGQPGDWRDPAAGLGDAPHTFGSPSWRGVDFLFVDGHVKRVRYDVDPQVLKALADPREKPPADIRDILE